jgi:hypothetical protein
MGERGEAMRDRKREPSVVQAIAKGNPWDELWFWNCGRPKCQQWIITPSIGIAPRGRGAATTEMQANTDMAHHIDRFHPVRRELPNVYDWRIYRGLATVWRWVRAGVHWYFTSPVPPMLGLIGIVGLLIIGAIELGGGA